MLDTPRWTVLLLALLACTGKPATDGPDDSAGDSGAPDACPVALVSPDELRWEAVAPGEGGEQALSLLNNCDGEQALSVLAEVEAPFSVTGSPVRLEPGGVATLGVSFDGVEDAVGTLLLTTNDPDQGSITVPLTATVDTDLDDDGHDAAEDCDDADPDVYPGAPETWYDGVDSDCSGGSDFDRDGDGVSELVYANSLSEHMSPYGGMVAVFRGGDFAGSTDLSDAATILNGETSYGRIGVDVATGDADGDGYDDLAVASSVDEDFLWLSDGLRGRDAYIGDLASVSLYGSGTSDIELWDADADGAVDLLAVDGDNFELYLGIGSATGTLAVPDLSYTPSSGGGGVSCSLPDAWLDSDGDGAAEPALYAYSSAIGGGAAAFFPGAGFADGAWTGEDAGWAVGAETFGASRLLAADLDGDGDTELVSSTSSYSSSRGGLTVNER